MILQFCFLLNVLLISRLILTFRDKPVGRKQTFIMILLQIIGLLAYEMNSVWALLAGVLIIVDLLFHYLENRFGKINELRLLSLLTHVTVLSVFFSPWVNVNFKPGLSDNLHSLGYYSLLFSASNGIDWFKLNILLLGLLLVTNEVNILIRYLFQIFRLAPKKNVVTNEKTTTNIDEREYNAGRIIGILERLIIYFLVLNAQFAAIGLILAAKSFTRFKELEKREFAEYVLIGTLLSTILAMVTAGMTKLLLP